MSSQHRVRGLPALHPLAACLIAFFGSGTAQAAPDQPQAVIVTSCQNDGPGSLRQAVIDAGNNGTVDLTQLTCSQITLTSGRIDAPPFMTIEGPGSGELTIDGNYNDRVFNGGIGFLNISGVTLRRGSGFLAGGCVYANGNLGLTDVTVTDCRILAEAGTSTYRGGGVFVNGILSMAASHIDGNRIYSSLGNAVGGGAYVEGDLSMTTSTISGNRADSAAPTGFARGGGAYVTGVAVVDYSTFAGNETSAIYSPFGTAGALVANGRASIERSTISGNTAGTIGGVQLKGGNTTPGTEIVNSTISGNRAMTGTIGGVYSKAALTVANSTIAFNLETIALGAGLFQTGLPASLQSSIIARNGGNDDAPDVGEGIGAVFGGANNLIENHGTSPVPSDTLAADPQLLPLANNGGRTQTHQIAPQSPAVDAGNNAATLTTDQRGAGFPRVVGLAADIGAVEADLDRIFANGFD